MPLARMRERAQQVQTGVANGRFFSSPGLKPKQERQQEEQGEQPRIMQLHHVSPWQGNRRGSRQERLMEGLMARLILGLIRMDAFRQ